ncbi:helix-turn-helix protein [Breznakibacter xylanolyticus]|uniref:Helix-turn-helix protein n=1 Tax=Breznakibacter xylanolyticus TaxID=990 RepID=A0A2W7NIN2_9BACT|nr:helix-turn-helix domain-containing protein [Breznakibacter xylanolyticus]PZX20098.1 helix-turn-helix protein [Breznakibacter xylanolyticus]
MPLKVITSEDLEIFKSELIAEIKSLLDGFQKAGTTQKWMKTKDVLALLKISHGTLQHLRITGQIPFSKIGGVIYYDAEEINQLIARNMIY